MSGYKLGHIAAIIGTVLLAIPLSITVGPVLAGFFVLTGITAGAGVVGTIFATVGAGYPLWSMIGNYVFTEKVKT